MAAAASATIDQPTTESLGTIVGPYKLLQQIGEGGMGAVYMADQLEPVRRRVALKIIKPGMDSRQVIARFEAERQALAMMDHQNIARVLDVGTTASGRPYFVMELVHGVPITQFCDDGKLNPRQRLELFVPVCQAIQHAHQKGIIHRDVKPSNVLVTMYDDLPVPKVIDFGVAKAVEQRLTEKTMFTQFGAFVGTFEYMSPEQAEMNAFGVDTRSDIYSLGVLLYELLTGTTPLEQKRLREAGLAEMVRLIKEAEAPRPSVRLFSSNNLPKIAAARNTDPGRLSGIVRGELDWIVMKCLEKDRKRRYETASGLARDIQRYLADEPVEACPPGAGYRLRKAARKHRTPLLVASAFLVLLVSGAVASAWQAVRATVAEREAESRKREADDARAQAEERRDKLAAVNDTLRRASYVADVNLAHVAWDENNLSRAHELLEKHRPRPGETDLRGFEWHYLRRLFQRDLLTVKAHPGGVTAVAFTPDGKRLVTSGASRPRQKYSDPRLGDFKLWDAATGQQLRFPLGGRALEVERVALSPDGTRLAATCLNQTVLVWELATGGLVSLQGPAGAVARNVNFSPDGKRLVCSFNPADDDPTKDSPRSIWIWDLVERRAVVTIDRLPWGGFMAPSFSPDGKLLAAPHGRGLVKVWDAATGHEVFSCKYADRSIVCDAAFSPDGKRLAICGYYNGIRTWDVASREMLSAWTSEFQVRECLAFSRDGKRLATGGIRGIVEVWDTMTGLKVQTFKGHLGPVDAIAFAPDGMRLATGSADGTLRLWDVTEPPEAVSIPKDAAAAGGFPDLSPDGQTLLTDPVSGERRPLRLWDTATGKPRCEAIELPQPAVSWAWTADGNHLYLADSGKAIRVVDVATGKVIRTFPVDAEINPLRYDIALSPDERWCANSGPAGTITVRDAQNGAPFRTMGKLEGSAGILAFGPDGSRLLGADEYGALKIWEVATGREIAATRLSGVLIQVARFSADGKRVAVAGLVGQLLTGEVRILDAETAREVQSLRGHSANVKDAVFSPDGGRLATASVDQTIRIWDLATGQEILKLSGDPKVYTVRFVAGGRRLIGASADRTIRVWDATPLPE